MKFAFVIALTIALTGIAWGQHPAPSTVSFGTRTSVEVPFKISNNLVILDVKVNGHTGKFIFDTGAESTVLDGSFAARAGLVKTGKTIGNGASGSAEAGVIKGATVEIGDLIARNLVTYSLPLDSFAPSFGFAVDGIIGNDITKKTVARIDYPQQRLTFYQPGAFTKGAAADSLPLILADGLLFMDTEVTGAGAAATKARMEVDTGSTGAVLLNAPFVKRNKLLEHLKTSIDHLTGGVGGTGTSKVGRIEMIRFGSSSIRQPITTFYTGTKGDNASSEYDGLIGGGIFKRFVVTVDIPDKRLLLEPTAKVNDPFDMDMSGLEILADGADLKTLLVDEVRPGSSGVTAGFQGGDIIRSVDGRDAAALGLEEVKRMFREDGRAYDVIVDRGGKVVTLHIVLKRVI